MYHEPVASPLPKLIEIDEVVDHQALVQYKKGLLLSTIGLWQCGYTTTIEPEFVAFQLPQLSENLVVDYQACYLQHRMLGQCKQMPVIIKVQWDSEYVVTPLP